MNAVENAEQRRWTLALGVPLLGAAAAVAGALAWTPWLFAGAVLLAPVGMMTLAILALSSDTNGEVVARASVAELPRRDAVERRAA